VSRITNDKIRYVSSGVLEEAGVYKNSVEGEEFMCFISSLS
jgi:galactose-1-phosphate uridylyltransferase